METVLNKIVQNINIEQIESEWELFSLSKFSKEKSLYTYQTEALKQILNVLYNYYQLDVDFSEGESTTQNLLRKNSLYNKYRAFLSDKNLKKFDIKSSNKNQYLFDIYTNHDGFIVDSEIKFRNLINKLSIWMATGSGKSLVIIKLFEMLDELIKRKEVPNNKILFLAPTDQIINQVAKLIDEYNSANNKYIKFVNLQKYEENSLYFDSLFTDEITVYYYRSDNITDETKEVQIDYREFLNDGKWYIILDEAHKGSKDSSKRQAYYSILSQNGFLFNFSATFTETEDIITNAYNYNLKKFIQNGHGKNIYLSDEEYNLKNSDSYLELDKKKIIILKTFINLTYLKLIKEKLNSNYYHSPLAVTLTNTVSSAESDLALYFSELLKFATNDFSEELFEIAKKEFMDSFVNGSNDLIYEQGKIVFDFDTINGINYDTVLKYVFNSSTPSTIEYFLTDSNKEIALRLKASENPTPFALIRIGDISEWKNSVLKGYDEIKSITNDSYFEKINEKQDLNIVMGSRAFYEGWDSNRPNILSLINIGISDAKKFLLQAIGRGIRLNPLDSHRQRLSYLYTKNLVDEKVYFELKDLIQPLETLFIYSTDKDLLKTTLELIISEDMEQKTEEIKLYKNENSYNLYLPVIEDSNKDLVIKNKFRCSSENLRNLVTFVNTTPLEVLCIIFGKTKEQILKVKDFVNISSNFTIEENVKFNDVLLIFNKLLLMLNNKEKVLNGFKILNDEILHFEKIKVTKDEKVFILKEIEKVKNYVELKTENDTEKILKTAMEGNLVKKSNYKELEIEYIAEHFYYPLIKGTESVDYISNIIKVQSEVNFVNKLNEFLQNQKELGVDWWFFSKITENVDLMGIPYLSSELRYRGYFPDFIFWMRKGTDYRIVYVDPKGTSNTGFMEKVEGFSKIFADHTYIKDNLNIKVELYFYNEVNPFAYSQYNVYWTDDIEDIFSFK